MAQATKQKKEQNATKFQAFNVYQNGVIIDTVFYVMGFNCEGVKRSLIEHDGYNPSIRVIKER